jgi:L-alanine-DL-glutamate epimerase-like enolase superfamily enzyme
LKIIDIRESTRPIKSAIRNAYIDFSKMTLSLVAVVTDVVRNGKPVIGYGFNSNGRYGQGGLIRERFSPRILEADPQSLLDETGGNLDPHKIWAAMMSNEKPGGHGERSVAVGTIDMAVWDAVAKIADKPLYQLLAERYGNGTPDRKVFVYAAGGYYWPGQGLEGLEREMRSYLDRGYSVVKKKIGGASIAEDCRRIEAVLKLLGPGQKLAADGHRLRQGAVAIRPVLVRRARRPARLRAAGRTRAALRRPHGDRGKPVFNAGCAQPDPLWRHAARPGLAAV